MHLTRSKGENYEEMCTRILKLVCSYKEMLSTKQRKLSMHNIGDFTDAFSGHYALGVHNVKKCKIESWRPRNGCKRLKF